MMRQKALDHQNVFGVLLQQVGSTGEIHDYSALISKLKARKVIVSVAADFMALVLLTAPGKQGCGYCFWLCATFWRADGLRRPARGVLCRDR
ncbi:glycine cleavage complex protein P, glycine decarboxylase [Salmonella enterica subsp. arizonae]|uniref:Glycine cleavage complex protein P, glycine decarboxylase n=1 Tax=Salmonella enterica subsp. arizonae TaxID=59203 RepID=A0A379T5J4_SALER|nr:glycine cleavage complex protein P, glycine decarboxylase [Salmonella enterica subsp. arizonae]